MLPRGVGIGSEQGRGDQERPSNEQGRREGALRPQEALVKTWELVVGKLTEKKEERAYWLYTRGRRGRLGECPFGSRSPQKIEEKPRGAKEKAKAREKVVKEKWVGGKASYRESERSWASKAGGRGGEETKEDALPPERSFECPAEPRAALAQKLQAQETKKKQLREAGAGEKRLERAEKRRQEVHQQLQVPGGRSAQTLGLQTRGEEENKRKAVEAIQRSQPRMDEREGQIQEL